MDLRDTGSRALARQRGERGVPGSGEGTGISLRGLILHKVSALHNMIAQSHLMHSINNVLKRP